MWDIEQTPDAALSPLIAAAILEAQQWLQGQQLQYGLKAATDRGLSWVLGTRESARHFLVKTDTSRIYDDMGNPSLTKSILLLARTTQRWKSSMEAESLPSPETSRHPLLWFPIIPWIAHLSVDRESLVLFCPEHRINGSLFSPAWTLTIPISITIWKILHRDYLRSTGQVLSGKTQEKWLPTRMALGDGVFIPALGFDVEWGSIVNTPVRINPLIEEFKKSNTGNPLFMDEAPQKVFAHG